MIKKEVTNFPKLVCAGSVKFGANNKIALIAGPCVIESVKDCCQAAKELKRLTQSLGIGFVFKSSFDKANRMSVDSFRGPGFKKGLAVLAQIKDTVGVPILSDVHCRLEVKEAAKVLDIIQIPALLCRQTDLVCAVADTGKVVNIKKGQFMAPQDMYPLVCKVESRGNKNILLTERGSSFGYNNLVVDFRSLVIMREFGYPVIFDATHSVQLPGGKGTSSGGQRQFVPALCRAAVAAGCDGLFLEVHPNPDKALCDGANMIDYSALAEIIRQLKQLEGK